MENVFVCASAYQIYMACKTIENLNLKNPNLIIVGNLKVPKITKNLLNIVKWKHIEENIADFSTVSEVEKFIDRAKYNECKYKNCNIYSGSITNTHFAILTYIYKPKTINILDDGTEALTYLNGYKMYHIKKKSILKRKIIGLYLIIKKNVYIPSIKSLYNKTSRFYTIFENVKDKRACNINTVEDIDIIENEGYFLGQSLVEDGNISEKVYINKLKKIFKYYKEKGINYRYIPHPREDLNKFSEISEIDILNIEDIFDVYIDINGVPRYISGFCSTALISSKIKFKDKCRIEAWCICEDMPSFNSAYKEIEKYKINVNIVN